MNATTGECEATDQAAREALRAAVNRAARAYFAERRRRVDAFARARFGLGGSLRLHRAALGWDIARAPANLALAPALVATRLAAHAAGAAGARGAARWLRGRRVLLATDVSRAVERAIVTDLLELPWDGAEPAPRDALAEAILAEPEVRRAVAAAEAVRASLAEYVGGRAAVAEFTVALGTLGLGAAAFQQVTPGMISLGPAVAAALAHQAAVAAFPLGASAGAIWYGLFPVAAPPALAIGATAGLAGLAAVAVAFAGVVADPLQVRVGMHQRRLRRLIDAMEQAFFADAGPGFEAREHYLARVFDLADVAAASLRVLRG
ncbi:DUF6635 family protein [Rubrimonas sp.]|uniref:DUF6635 family protein n=1 Tax=Rubrimonas sp. TaxID=2036015 RepID=UPI002FDC8EAB